MSVSFVDTPSPSPSRGREGSLAAPSRGREGSLRFQGYAAVFDRVDRAGDVFRRGVFADAVPVPLLVRHRGGAVGEMLAIGEDHRGLWIEALVSDPEIARLVRCGALGGLSVGYRALAVQQGAWRAVLRAALVEVSLVAVPMQAAARVAAVFEI